MLTAAMIVKDGAATIARSIASVRPFVDEVVVYLAGESTDDTAEILDRLAGEPGPPVRFEQGVWEDDFALARERSFAMASPDADWLMFLDDDHVVRGGENLKALLSALPEDLDHVKVSRFEGTARQKGWRWIVLTRPSACRWAGLINENLYPVDASRELAFAWANPEALAIEHWPVAVEGRHAYSQALQARLDALPDDDRLKIWLVEALGLQNRHAEAEAQLVRYLAATEGSFVQDRLLAFSMLAGLRQHLVSGAAGDRVAREKAAYIAAWEREARAGRLAGYASLGPYPSVDFAAGDLFALPFAPARLTVKVGRNDPCWCGSGEKSKRCCGAGRTLVEAAS